MTAENLLLALVAEPVSSGRHAGAMGVTVSPLTGRSACARSIQVVGCHAWWALKIPTNTDQVSRANRIGLVVAGAEAASRSSDLAAVRISMRRRRSNSDALARDDMALVLRA
jgi:hypothetical protein